MLFFCLYIFAGLKYVHEMTSEPGVHYELRIDVQDASEHWAYEKAANFWVSDSGSDYTYHSDQGYGDAGKYA